MYFRLCYDVFLAALPHLCEDHEEYYGEAAAVNHHANVEVAGLQSIAGIIRSDERKLARPRLLRGTTQSKCVGELKSG